MYFGLIEWSIGTKFFFAFGVVSFGFLENLIYYFGCFWQLINTTVVIIDKEPLQSFDCRLYL